MRLFISYARVDKYYCTQIVEILDVHDVWYDRRIHAGQQWWDEIQRRLEWCDGFIYLLSPDSVASEYCQKEFALALSMGKHIFPVLIQARTPIPDAMGHIQYADFSNGLTTEAVKSLLNALYVDERDGARVAVAAPVAQPVALIAAAPVCAPDKPAESMIDEAADALENGLYDRAVFLLKEVRSSGNIPRFIDLDAMLNEAEEALEWQAYLREAAREYSPIAALVRRDRTRHLGSEAFREFRKNFPGYDPENLASICMPYSIPMLEWCSIPAGDVVLDEDEDMVYQVDSFEISKYPVTNAQFQEFIDAEDGYCEEHWWDYSAAALAWRHERTDPLPSRTPGKFQPRVNVCWYEAVAFCRWLSVQTGRNIDLATEQQWQRAAQGDDGRLYPWGDQFDTSRCNTRESGQRAAVPVNQYKLGASPYDVFDMAGNVWEWCLNRADASSLNLQGEEARAVRGGSFISPADRSQCRFRFSLDPRSRYDTIGFRVVALNP